MVHPFIKRLIVWLFIVMTMFTGLATAMLYQSNELFVSGGSSIETDDDVLWGDFFEQPYSAYKIRRARYVKPDVMVLGSSRVNQVREQFYPGVKFYNASLAAGKMSTVMPFLEALDPAHLPKVLLLNLDLWWFREANAQDKSIPDPFKGTFNLSDRLAMLIDKGFTPRFLKTIFANDFDPTRDPIAGRRPVGFMAMVEGNGFRPDGSRQRGDFILGTDIYRDIHEYGPRHNFRYYTKSAAEGSGRLDVKGGLSETALSQLSETLDYARSKNITVVLYTASMASPVLRALRANKKLSDFEREVIQSVQKVVDIKGIQFFNFHNPATLDLPDEWFFDGLHPTEFSNLQMHRKMISEVPILTNMVDVTKIPDETPSNTGISVFDRIAR